MSRAESYDAVVAGGGLTGVAAALSLARQGLRVIVCEPTGALGREITRGRNQFADLPKYAEISPSIQAFFHSLQERKGWFHGEIDPSVAAVAFDDLVEKHRIQVLFNAWPSHIITEGRDVQGVVIAAKKGYSVIHAPRVVDATAHGKLARQMFISEANQAEKSVLHLVFNGINEPRSEKRSIVSGQFGEVRVACRPTYWNGELRVSLAAARAATRAEWLRQLPELLPALKQQLPALQGGGMSFVADEAWQTPDVRIRTDSRDERVVGCVDDLDGKPFELRLGMLGDPQTANGFTMAGIWLHRFLFDPVQEERAIINAFRLGDVVGHRMME